MVFSDSDRAVIEACFREKGWHGARIVKEFPGNKWSSVNKLVKKIKDTGSTSRQSGSGRPRTACTDENKDNVEDMIQSEEDLPGTHHPQRKIDRELGVSQSSVSRLAHKLKLKAYKRIRVSRRDRQNDRVYGKWKRDIAPNRLYHKTSSKRLWYLLEFLGKEKAGFTLSIQNVLK